MQPSVQVSGFRGLGPRVWEDSILGSVRGCVGFLQGCRLQSSKGVQDFDLYWIHEVCRLEGLPVLPTSLNCLSMRECTNMPEVWLKRLLKPALPSPLKRMASNPQSMNPKS